MAKGIPHFKRDGTRHTGSVHKMADGRLHTGKTHSSSSVRLFHADELSGSAKKKAMAYGKKKPTKRGKKK